MIGNILMQNIYFKHKHRITTSQVVCASMFLLFLISVVSWYKNSRVSLRKMKLTHSQNGYESVIIIVGPMGSRVTLIYSLVVINCTGI